jgi:hypothetical protein
MLRRNLTCALGPDLGGELRPVNPANPSPPENCARFMVLPCFVGDGSAGASLTLDRRAE